MLKFLKIFLLVSLPFVFYLFFAYDLHQELSFAALKNNQAQIKTLIAENFFVSLLGYFSLYIAVTALSLPGAAILTLAGGAIFGLWYGTLLVSFASTTGATLAFLLSRFLFRDFVKNKFRKRVETIDRGIEKEGSFYLFALRLVPAFPFFVINLVMGLTSMRVGTFFLVSQIGMLPGTLVYVNAGTQLAKVTSLSDILSLPLLLSFAFLGLLPVVSRKVLQFFKQRKIYRKFLKPKQFDYNLVAIGAGAAGLVTAYIGAAVKAKVALIEKHKMGGDCLNTGCVPSKALIRTATFVQQAKEAKKYGLANVSATFEFADVMDRVQRVIKKVEPHDSVERYTELGVDCLQGEAKIVSPWEVEVNGKIITTNNIVVATGARPFVPPFPGLDKVDSVTSDTIWSLREQPKRLLVLGGGPIGCELAQCFQRLGSQVILVEKGSRLMQREDPEISSLVQDRLQAEGMQLELGWQAIQFVIDAGVQKLIVEKEGQKNEIAFDKVLIALGRRANVQGFGLEEIGVELRPNGTIAADDFLRTNIPNIFTCGDVTGPYQFTHVAAHQAWFCSVNALFGFIKKFRVDYSVVPWATYTEPEVARVGLNELEATEQGIAYEVTTYGIDDLDRAIADEEDHGVVKVLTEPGKDKILGVTIAGAHAGDLIAEFVTAMKYNLGLNKILGTIHIYPTMAEANKYAAGNWKKAHTPEKALRWVEWLHRVRRG